jgi:hypothetical protein
MMAGHTPSEGYPHTPDKQRRHRSEVWSTRRKVIVGGLYLLLLAASAIEGRM